MLFVPRIEGSVTVRTEPRAFLDAFTRRVETGLFPGAAAARSQYAVSRQAADRLQVRAATLLTAVNVGLNQVDLAGGPERQVRYVVTYWRWAAYALALCGALGIALIATFLALDIRDYIARHPTSQLPGWSIDQSAALAWSMALFWGFIWPWLLIALHKRPLRRLIERIIAEVDAAIPQPR